MEALNHIIALSAGVYAAYWLIQKHKAINASREINITGRIESEKEKELMELRADILFILNYEIRCDQHILTGFGVFAISELVGLFLYG